MKKQKEDFFVIALKKALKKSDKKSKKRVSMKWFVDNLNKNLKEGQ